MNRTTNQGLFDWMTLAARLGGIVLASSIACSATPARADEPAAEHKPSRRFVPVGLGGEPIELRVPTLRDVNEPNPLPKKPTPPEKPTSTTERSAAATAALVLELGGLGGLAAGAGLAGMAGLSPSTAVGASTGFVLGGLGVVAGGITWFASKSGEPRRSSQATFVLVPRVGLTEGGLSVVGRF